MIGRTKNARTIRPARRCRSLPGLRPIQAAAVPSGEGRLVVEEARQVHRLAANEACGPLTAAGLDEDARPSLGIGIAARCRLQPCRRPLQRLRLSGLLGRKGRGEARIERHPPRLHAIAEQRMERRGDIVGGRPCGQHPAGRRVARPLGFAGVIGEFGTGAASALVSDARPSSYRRPAASASARNAWRPDWHRPRKRCARPPRS